MLTLDQRERSEKPAAAGAKAALSLTLVIGCTPGAITSLEPDFFVFLLLISGQRAVLGCKAHGLALAAGSEDMKQSLELSSTQTQPHPGATLPPPRWAQASTDPIPLQAVCVPVPTLPVSLPACCLPIAQEPALHPPVSSVTTMAQPLENSSAQSERIYQEKPLCAQQQPTTDVPPYGSTWLFMVS